MSELKSIVRDFSRQVEEAENRTAKTLGEVAGSIAMADKERRDRINDAARKIQEGAEMVAEGTREIMGVLDTSERDTAEIIAQVLGMKAIRIGKTGKPTLIGGKDGTNG